MEKSKKNIIIQVLWIIVVGIGGITGYAAYDDRDTKQAAEPQTTQSPIITIEEFCAQQEEDKLSNYPPEEQDALRKYVSPVSYKDCVEKLNQPTKPGRTGEDLLKFAERMDIWGD